MTESTNPITHELTLEQPLDEVWQAISEPEKIRQWFGSDAKFSPYEGAIGYFAWEQECEGKFAIQIESISAPHYFAYRWMAKQDTPYDPDHATLVEWRLEKVGENLTRVIMTESGFSDPEHRAMNVEGWDKEMADLHEMLEFCAR